ncbi:Early transcription elongation factor of RNA pol II NGN section family protein [Babesia bovis T2Bo]|uniref:KOW motif family protein n=1 Tax=Babesia bovis TaxID=5865 RepID=A7AM03_BABBO|nr:Early transcription elongation factor of RNA pol II NGN section family protein [Babesia bovis T2Bo]EDO07587.1 Early transcription elongation factor of RNA pol II NGN section family protein [Babesia bovis T2Bo]|eukprot:XP_001611155.1 KOW motif family protein [Babesia bovis T2Bo]
MARHKVDVDDLSFPESDASSDNDKPTRKKLKLQSAEAKRRAIVSAFLDTEAQVGDEEDEENYEEDLFLPDESTEAENLENRSRIRRMLDEPERKEDRRIGGAGLLENAIDKLTKRYQDMTFDEEDEDFIDDGEAEAEQSYGVIEDANVLIPDINDPKLWMLKLNKSQSSKFVAISLLNKFLKLQGQGRKLGIYSCFAPDEIKSFIYVEADTKSAIIDAFSDLRNLNLSKLKMVPINEVSTIYAMESRQQTVPLIGEYVRIKTGRYAGDLAQVHESDELNGTVVVKVIPRLQEDSKNFEGLNVDDKGSEFNFNKANMVKKTKSKIFVKRLFDREAVELKGGLIEQGFTPGTFRYNNMTFLDAGFLLLRISVRRIVVGSAVDATLSELKEFNLEDNYGNVANVINTSNLHLFRLGEKIRVTRGELINVIGHIASMHNDEIEIQPEDESIPNFKIQPSCVMKYFQEGDNVRIIDGINRGESGLISIVDFEKKTAVVFSPQKSEQFKVKLDYLVKVKETVSFESLGSLNGYFLGDLIQSSKGEVGIIVSISKSCFTVLLDTNVEAKWVMSDILCKRSSFGYSSKDVNNATLYTHNKVLIVNGPYKNKQGVVKHLWKNKCFVQLEKNVYLVVDSGVVLNMSISETPNFAEQREAPERGLESRYKNKIRVPNKFIGKTVKILVGRHKGLLGDVISVDQSEFTIILKVKPMVVRIKKVDVTILDNRDLMVSKMRYANTLFDKSSLKSKQLSNQTGKQVNKWIKRGVVIRIIGNGEYRNKIGIIDEVVEDQADTDLQIVHVFVDEDYIAIAAESVEVLRPTKENQVVTLLRENDVIGTVVSVGETHVTVRLENGSDIEEAVENLALYGSLNI